jgi:dTMP kinase
MLIAVEGADGTGSTTHTEIIASKFREYYGDDRVYSTCEPSGNPIGKLIREVLRDGGPMADSDVMQHLFRADRIVHFREEIWPRLCEGVHVVTDRYVLSTVVYQSVAELSPRMNGKRWPGVVCDMKKLWREILNRDQIHDADVVLVLDLDEDTAKKRREERGLAEEVYEKEDTQIMVREGYRRWVENGGGDIPFRYFLVDADGTVDEVADRCWRTILDRFGGKLP